LLFCKSEEIVLAHGGEARVFLVFEYLDLARIDLGQGKRVIEPDGVYDSKYRISLR
jgi:hypothetical protein